MLYSYSSVLNFDNLFKDNYQLIETTQIGSYYYHKEIHDTLMQFLDWKPKWTSSHMFEKEDMHPEKTLVATAHWSKFFFIASFNDAYLNQIFCILAPSMFPLQPI